MAKVQKMTELYVTTKNEVGALAKCTMWFNQNGVNIDGLCAYAKDENTAAFHFVTADPGKAKEGLTQNGYNVSEYPVICWNAGNNPGTLNKATSAMAEKQIDINYTYATGGPGNTASWIVFNTNNNDETYNTLNNL